MPYAYVSAMAKPKGQGMAWAKPDLSNVLIETVLNDYAKVVLRLYDNFTDKNYDFILTDHRMFVTNYTVTVVGWLNSLGNAALPMEPELLTTTYSNAIYRDAMLADYRVDIVAPLTHPDVPASPDEKRDLLLQRGLVDYGDMGDYIMATVNGYFYPTSWSNDGFRISEGGSAGKLCNDNLVGLLSFENIGKITQVPITEEMLWDSTSSNKLKDKAFINLGQPIEGKSLIVVIGGYIHFGTSGVFDYVGNNTIVVNMHKIALAQRFFESRQSIEMVSLTQYLQNEETGLVSLENLYSDAFLKAYLTMPQSFIVIVDTLDLMTKRHVLRNDHIPKNFITEITPEHLLMTKKNCASEYWYQEDNGVYVVTVRDNINKHFNFETTPWLADLEKIEDVSIGEFGHYLDDVAFVEIGSESLVPET